MRNYKIFKNLSLILVFTLFMITLIGCGGSKIELSFDEDTYTVQVGKELLLDPNVLNEKNEEYTLVYSSSQSTTATYVDGVVKGVANGETKVRVELEGNNEIYAEVTIKVVEATKYTITFNTDGGSAIQAVQVLEKESVDKPLDPTKVGYRFVNWYSNEAKTLPYNFKAPVSSSLTLYAKWEIIQYTVTFDTDGGSVIDDVLVNHGSKVNEPADPTKENNQFVGWFIPSGEDEEMVEFNFDTELTSDITVYASWELNSYDVIFNSSEGSTVDNQNITHGEKLTKPEDPTKLGFEFVGWFKDSAKTQAFNFDTDVIINDTVLYAKWRLDEVNATLNSRGGIISGVELEFGPKDGVTPKVQDLFFYNSGYNAANAEKSIFLYEGDHQIFGGDEAGKEVAWWGYKVALTKIAPNTFIVEKNIGNEKDVPQGVYDYILLGLWRPNTYTGFTFVQFLVAGEVLVIQGVDFEAEGSAVEATITKYALTEINNYYPLTIEPGTVLPTPTKTGFVFAGWYDNASFLGESYTTITEDTTASTFYAKWDDAQRFEVSFVTGVEELNIYPVLRLSGQTVKVPTLVREGYNLVGWFTDAELTTEFNFETQITENITLYAKWEEAPVVETPTE